MQENTNNQLIHFLWLIVIVLILAIVLLVIKPFKSRAGKNDLVFKQNSQMKQPAADAEDLEKQSLNQNAVNLEANSLEENKKTADQQSPPINQVKEKPMQLSKPEMKIDPQKEYAAVMKTSLGEIRFKLYANDTPLTVNNFIYLASNDFYNGTTFHRVIKDFMIQGGDPTGTGRGGPGYQFKDEPSSNKLVKGSLAMANSGPDTNGSQFFIVTADSTPWLDDKHTNFGEVVSGMDVVEKIAQVKTGAQDRPIEPIKINSIEIIQSE